MDLYRVYHSRPRGIQLGSLVFGSSDAHRAVIGVDERVIVAQLPYARLRDFIVSRHLDNRELDVRPVGDSAAVCGMCQFTLATHGDYCRDCAKYAAERDEEVA